MSVATTETTFTDRYTLDSNPLYTHQPEDLVSSIDTCALTSTIKGVESKSLTPDACNFEITLDKNSQFLSTAFKVLVPITFKFTLNTPLAEKPTAADYMTTFFKNYIDLCISDGGLTNAITTCETELGNIPISTTNYNIACRMISPYYAQDMTDIFTESSVADVYPDFEMYSKGNSDKINFFSEYSEVVTTNGHSTAPENPFVNSYSKDRNSRTPAFKFISSTEDSVTVTAYFWIFLNLGVHTLPSNPTALPGVDKCNVTIRFSQNLPGLVFNTRKDNNVMRYKDIAIDPSSATNNKARLYTQIFSPPTFMRKEFVDSANRIKPYKIHFPIVQTVPLNVYPGPTDNNATLFSMANFSPGSIPKSMYIALVRNRQGSNISLSNIPNSFGLINDLEIDVNGTSTIYRDMSALHYLSGSNGYSKVNSRSKQMIGYPIKLDFTKDVGIPGDALVGQASSFNIRIQGNFRDPHVDRPAGTSHDFQLVVITVQDGVLHYDGDQFHISKGVIVPDALASSQAIKEMLYSQSLKDPKVLGSGLLSNAAKWVAKNVPRLAQSAWKNRAQIAKHVGDAITLAKTIKGSGNAIDGVLGAGLQHNPYTGAGSADKITYLNKMSF